MKPYTKQDIDIIYGRLIQSANKNYNAAKLEHALKDIETAANWAYNFNHIYTDHETERLLKQIGSMAVEPVQIMPLKTDHCVLIDSFLLDNRGLSQQYIRAMMANKMHILVVYTNAGGNPGTDTMAEIKAYDKAEIITFPTGINRIEEAKRVVKSILDFSPAHIFLHLTPWDTVALMVCHAVKGASIYQINITDHAYWLGAEFIDYNLEFRPYGMTVSVEKRGLKQERCLALPYYPITPISTEFEGLPQIPENAIKIFTGGSLYKMLGKDDIFFQMMERILAISSNVFILVAGFDSDKRFDKKIARLKGRERVLQIGMRRDIDAVFELCDIYLGTYPIAGGLMSQYAAKHGKPIISYHDKGDKMNAVEEFVNFFQQEFQSFDDLTDMTVYAEKLINCEDYRVAQGSILQAGMMNEERFNNEFLRVISLHQSSFTWQKDEIDCESLFEYYLELENTKGFGATKSLVVSQKLLAFTKLNSYWTNISGSVYDVIKNTPPHRLFQFLYSRITRHLRFYKRLT